MRTDRKTPGYWPPTGWGWFQKAIPSPALYFTQNNRSDGSHQQFCSVLETEDELWFGADNGRIRKYSKKDRRFGFFDLPVISGIIQIHWIWAAGESPFSLCCGSAWKMTSPGLTPLQKHSKLMGKLNGCWDTILFRKHRYACRTPAKYCSAVPMACFLLLRGIKLQRAAQLLSDRRLSIKEVVYMIGMTDARYFRECFKRKYGKNPSEFRNA